MFPSHNAVAGANMESDEIRSNGILTFRYHPQPKQIRRFPRSGAFIPTATYGIALFLMEFIAVRFLGGHQKVAKIQGSRHLFRTFMHKVIHSFCA